MRRDLVLYDGSCGLCHASVRFALARDRQESLEFAPLAGQTAGERLTEAQRAGLPDSLVLLRADGTLLVRSDAVLQLWRRLSSPWPALARVGSMVPRPVRDALYRAVASTRRRWMRAPSSACPLVTPELARRLLP